MATRTVKPGSEEAKRIDAITNPKVAMVNAPPSAAAPAPKAKPAATEPEEEK